MDRRVETFLQAAECESFSETARRMFVTQPAVTQQVASLGDELGVRLFERDGNRMVLTTPGRIAREHFLRMREEDDALRQDLAPWTARRSFVVGCPQGMIDYDGERYSQVLQAAMRCFSGADVRGVKLATPEQHFHVLADHRADVIISGLEPMQREHAQAVDFRMLRGVTHYLVCPRESRFAAAGRVGLDALAGEVVFVFEGEAFPDNLLRALDALEPQPSLRRQVSLASTLPLVQAGRGVTVFAQVIPLPDDLALVPLDFEVGMHVGLVWLRRRHPSGRAFAEFVDAVEELYRPDRE